MDRVILNVNAFFAMCQDFIANKIVSNTPYNSLDYSTKVRLRRSRTRRRGSGTAVTMADLLSWRDSAEKWRIDETDVIVVSFDNQRTGWPKLLKEEVWFVCLLIEVRHNRVTWDGFDRVRRDILASLVCTEKKMGPQGRMLSTKEQEAWLMSCVRDGGVCACGVV